MLDALRGWILTLAGAALFCGVVTEICPSGSSKNVLKLLCGVVMAIALISPLIKFDLPSYSLNMSKYRAAADEISLSAKEKADAFSRTIIEEECRAYILDKADILQVEVRDASVNLRWDDSGFWYPEECSIDGEYNPELSALIESELGLGKNRQNWRNNEGT